MLNRMSTQCLPRALDIKARVERGDRLGFFDLRFLEEVCAENFIELTLWQQHPELDGIVGAMIHLYHEIAARALDNEYEQSLGRAGPMGARVPSFAAWLDAWP